MFKKFLSYALAIAAVTAMTVSMPIPTHAEKIIARSDDACYLDFGKYDVNEDNVVTASEVKSVKSLTVMTDEGLEKIKYFPKLKSLTIAFLKSKAVNLSGNKKLKNVDCSFCKVESLDVSNCTNLKKLVCIESNLKTLKVGNCKKLKELNCGDNELENLDVSECDSLQQLRCYSNKFESLDVSNCSKLERLVCYHNSYLKNIKASKSIQKICCDATVSNIEGASQDCVIVDDFNRPLN